jgi:uncharacterized protein (TIGR00369 family)
MSDETGGFAGRLGAVVTDADEGTARLEFEATDEHLNPAGTVHGGVLATLVDTAMGTAVRSATDDGDVPATSQLTVTYLRPGRPGRLTVDARVRTRGEHSRSARPTSTRTAAPSCTPSPPSRCCTPDPVRIRRESVRHPIGGQRFLAQLSSVTRDIPSTQEAPRRHHAWTLRRSAPGLPLPG